MRCPKCNNKLPTLSIVKLTRWSHLTCGSCQSRLKRQIDLQFILVMLLAVVLLILPSVFIEKRSVFVSVQILMLFVFVYIDAATVKLIEKKE